MELIKRFILAILGLGLAIALTACDEKGPESKEEGEKNLKERYHRKW